MPRTVKPGPATDNPRVSGYYVLGSGDDEMASEGGTETSDADDREAEFETFRKTIEQFKDLIVAAFDELHELVSKKIATPHQYFSNHHDYPQQSTTSSGFPIFNETGFYAKEARKDYVGSIRPMGLLGMLMIGRDKELSPELGKLVAFLDADELGEHFRTSETSEWEIEKLIDQAVESYFQRFGTGPLDPLKRRKVLAPIVRSAFVNSFELRIVIPIALTHFNVDRFRLSDTAYVTRIPKGVQLSRARMDLRGSGAGKNVVGAATHAFVSKNWNLEFETNDEARRSMNNPSKNVLDEADIFFGALRAATGARTGYAQVLMIPKGVAFEMYCDLPQFFGATYRRYPSDFDDYAWAYTGQSRVTAEQIKDVQRLYSLTLSRPEERVRIALKRLNACMSRDDAVDAILDAMIGLEVLLGDSENQALSYKLRMRAGALATLKGNRTAAEVSAEMGRIYGIRSEIVHGLSSQGKKAKKKVAVPEEERYAADRDAAAAMLRYILNILLEHHRYLEPQRIDRELLLGEARPAERDTDELDLFPTP
ncbi:HEPN domain-containing protein [Methylobacterium sp. 37f]|uniref:HEPN domain-containing protein n=1 Tax=Methylobacterium sp. 37f TaxID=2817058 RepID=UPI001FFC8BE8|nr:HEPN domain-containing protein [Methylobacterium sp. 37f]MCK2055298.1 hypothetical protein [Methylobacterium sp. 37f]